jgi:hypothetical protein
LSGLSGGLTYRSGVAGVKTDPPNQPESHQINLMTIPAAGVEALAPMKISGATRDRGEVLAPSSGAALQSLDGGRKRRSCRGWIASSLSGAAAKSVPFRDGDCSL